MAKEVKPDGNTSEAAKSRKYGELSTTCETSLQSVRVCTIPTIKWLPPVNVRSMTSRESVEDRGKVAVHDSPVRNSEQEISKDTHLTGLRICQHSDSDNKAYMCGIY
jgi:hypothetical protein